MKDKNLSVKDILSSAQKGKLVIKLPKVLNKSTGKETNVPFLFSASNFRETTRGFVKSIRNKPAGYVEATTNMARATLQEDINADTSLSSFDEDADQNICAFICEHPSFILRPTDPHHYRILFTCVHISTTTMKTSCSSVPLLSMSSTSFPQYTHLVLRLYFWESP